MLAKHSFFQFESDFIFKKKLFWNLKYVDRYTCKLTCKNGSFGNGQHGIDVKAINMFKWLPTFIYIAYFGLLPLGRAGCVFDYMSMWI